ncbi:MAG: hypothetical protein OEZ01_09305 [Candidatus Heimdallarchaeota archaeon]|nr:hypothetical protein [Candidatus Heimdallarchaeota archaeon]MDH5646192.1 hypothetical protein [Candidatus Heimdallarchaeota archaeon]
MSKFIKDGIKGAGSVGGSLIKTTIGAFLADLFNEILEETGLKDIAKDKFMEIGYKVVKELNIDPRSLQKDIIKAGILRELGIK